MCIMLKQIEINAIFNKIYFEIRVVHVIFAAN